MESTRIVAIRHGETAWNVDGRIQGQLDIPLNDTGRRQARRMARALAAREPLAAVYTSDLARAHDTALALAHAAGLAPTAHPGLRERNFGGYQGLTFPEIEARWPEASQRWRRRDPDWAPPDGESLLAVRARVLETVGAIAAAHPGRLIALVTHGGVLDQLYRAATGLDLQAARTWELANTSINRLLWTPDGLHLVGWADTTHLEDLSLDETGT